MSKKESIKDKIEKLLRLAESSNPHEAELATKRAEALMIQWGIEAAELDAKRECHEEIVEVHREYSANSRAWIPFAHSVMMGMGGIKTLKLPLGGPRVRFYVIGHKSDVERAGMLLDSLEMQANRALFSWWSDCPEKHTLPKSQWYKAKHQFIWSSGNEVGRRLKEQRAEQVEERGTGTALVLVNRDKKVEDWLRRNHNVVKSRGAYQGSHVGHSAGRAAGSRASLGEKGVGGGRAALR